MCLRCTNKRQIATEDIVCYKVLEKTKFTTYVSPYQEFLYVVDELVESPLVYDEACRDVNIGLHTFVSLNDAKTLSHVRKTYYTFECVIPKDSQYFTGYCPCGASYASDKLIVKRKID
jgi:hypothetical protein